MKFHLRINSLLLIISLLAFRSVHLSPETFWVVGFISLSIPFLLLGNLFYVYYWWRKKQFKYLLLPLITFIVGWSQITRTFSFNFSEKKTEATQNEKLSVLSGNVHVFNVYKHLRKDNPGSSESLISWLSKDDNDILCFQEYYNEPGSKTYGVTRRMVKNYKYRYVKPAVTNKIGGEFGVAIFTKLPIEKKGYIEFNNTVSNQAIYADILWNNSIIRVYNIHLESMHISEKELFDGKNSKENIKRKGKDTFRRLKKGFQARAQQIDLITKHIEKCPYPVIVCGDLNDLPYSYSYQQLTTLLNNAFEEQGLWLGTTYNGKLPFLRIDNQFFSNDFDITNFKVHNDIDYSDHFPIQGTYIKKRHED